MRVLLQGRTERSLASSPGGDQVQLEKTAQALRDRHGVDAHISSELQPDLTTFDAVHLFGLVRPQEVWVQARHAVRSGKPIMLSTVYCDMWEFDRRARTGPAGLLARHSNRDTVEALKAAARGVRSGEWSRGSAALLSRGFTSMQRDILGWTSAFLPNSGSEWDRVRHDFDFDAPDDAVFIVPNGIDARTFTTHSEEVPAALERFRDCVLCVARVEGRKNQLSVIRALQDSGRTLVLAGQASRNQASYVSQVRAAARESPDVHMLGAIDESTKQALYRIARVHVLASWMETTGLSSLEAAAADCRLVVTPHGDTREYFGSDAEYCDPAEPKSIRAAIDRAFDRTPSAPLSQRIRERYTWERAAHATFEAYRAVLDRG